MKVFLVLRKSFSAETGDIVSVVTFTTEEKARDYFEDIVNELMKAYYGCCDTCSSTTNSVSFYNEGEYKTWHDCVLLFDQEAE